MSSAQTFPKIIKALIGKRYILFYVIVFLASIWLLGSSFILYFLQFKWVLFWIAVYLALQSLSTYPRWLRTANKSARMLVGISLSLIPGIFLVFAFRIFTSIRHEKHAALLIDKGQYEEAIPLLREGIDLWPALSPGHYYLGVALAATGKQNEAIGAYRQAIRLMPDFSSAQYDLGNALNKIGNRSEARKWWKAASRGPELPWARAAQEELNKYP